jgi:tRNA (guanine-N7-)-methyltransferase
MTMGESQPGSFNPRMHRGGKLSFRRRVERPTSDAGSFLVHGGANPPGLRDLVPSGHARVEIEIGSGKGAFLLAATEARPDAFLLGIEAAAAYAEYAAIRLKQSGRANGRILVDNGKLFLQDRVPEGALDAIHVYYPDPWPKRRHQGRRFFTPDVPAILAAALAPGGFCFVATDNAAYAGQIARVMGSAPEFCCDEAEAERRLALGQGHAFTPTNFERKYAEAGRTLRRYAFRKKAP